MFWMNVRLRFLFLGCLLFVLTIYVVDAQVVSRQKQGQMRELNALANNQTREASLRMLAIWDSLNTNHHNLIYHLVPISFWEKSLEKKIRLSIQDKEEDIRLKAAYALAHVYYVQLKIKETAPLIDFLYSHKKQLTRKQYGSVLIKKEEIHRFYKDIAKAVKVRNERVENGFIKTYWELYFAAGLYNEAIQDFKSFEKLPERPFRNRMMYFVHLGDMYFESKQLDSAFHYYRIGLKEVDIYLDKIKRKEIIEEGNFPYWRGWFTGLMANCLVEKEQYARARPMLDYYLKMSPADQRINSLIPLSICYFHLGEIEKGKVYLDSAQVLLQPTMYGPNEFKFLKAKSDYFKAKNEMDSAYLFLEAYNKKKGLYEAGLLKNQSLLLLGRMEIDKRRTELKLTQKDLIKTKEDSSLQKKQLFLSLVGLVLLAISTALILINYRQKSRSKNIIEKKNIELAAFAEINLRKSQHNEQLVKELHHRVKNNLQNIYSLLNIQKRRIVDEETKNFVTSIQNRINSMAVVHESLYSDDTRDSVNFEHYVKNLVDHIKLTYEKEDQRISLSYSIDSVQLSLEKIILLGLIINESVSNAYKYLTSEQGNQLFISLEVAADMCTLTIRDDGPGFDPKAVNRTSLGLKLIQMMVVQLEASYSMSSEKGVEHRIQFKA